MMRANPRSGNPDHGLAPAKQTRLMSLVEAIANVVIGYGIAVLTQLIVFPWFGLPAHLDDALAIGAAFTAVSIARSFALRRLFEAVRVWMDEPEMQLSRRTIDFCVGRQRD